MRKIMDIISLSQSKVSEDSYIVILSDENEEMRIPIIINYTEAISIANSIGDLDMDIPYNMYDTMLNILNMNGNIIQEIEVTDFIDGIFVSYLIIDNEKIPCRIGDCLVFASIFNVDIFFQNDLIEKVGIKNDNSPMEYDISPPSDSKRKIKSDEEIIAELEKELNRCLEIEDYDRAHILKNSIDEIKKK